MIADESGFKMQSVGLSSDPTNNNISANECVTPVAKGETNLTHKQRSFLDITRLKSEKS